MTYLKKLDTQVDKYTKKWAGVPRSATNVVIHSKEGMDIPTISEIYTLAHNSSHTRTRLQGDMVVNLVLDHTLAREAQYSRMHCTTTEAERVYKETLILKTPDGEIPNFIGDKAKEEERKFIEEMKKAVKVSTKQAAQARLQDHAKGLQLQGHFLTLASQEKSDVLWKSTMFQLKSGTLKFMMNASIDTLPTPANLARWKYTSSNKCKLCGNKGTTNHILNCCKVMLDSARYTWRHNNIVHFIVTNVDSRFKVYSDLPGWEAAGGGTIPPALCVTNLKPDIVIMDEHKKTLHIFELTMPLNRNIDDRNKEKTMKYTPFLTDITGYNCTLNCFEISSTGFINTRNKTTLNIIHKFIKKSITKSTFMENLNSLAWYGSYKVWLNREDPGFATPPFLVPHLGL